MLENGSLFNAQIPKEHQHEGRGTAGIHVNVPCAVRAEFRQDFKCFPVFGRHGLRRFVVGQVHAQYDGVAVPDQVSYGVFQDDQRKVRRFCADDHRDH